jgi:hypothetical protein
MLQRGGWRRKAAGVALAAWFVALTGTSGIMLGRHLLALRATENPAQAASALATLRRPEDGDKLLVVHVLYASCRCSQRIMAHLTTSTRPTSLAAEVVLLVGDDEASARALEAKRFRVMRISVEELAAYHIDVAPLLVVLGRDGTPRYSGGYTAQKQGLAIRDLDIVARAAKNERPSDLPVFGCAVATDLRRRLDPTGVF